MAYAKIYNGFEELQSGNNSPLTSGDQKTGVIAEYYAKCYLESKIEVTAEYAKPGSPYDLYYATKSGKINKIQVKGVSAYSKSRTIAPLHLGKTDGNPPLDELYLIDLDSDFLPIAFYVNTYDQIISKVEDPNRKKIAGSKMKDLVNGTTNGSSFYDFSENKISELKKAINYQIMKNSHLETLILKLNEIEEQVDNLEQDELEEKVSELEEEVRENLEYCQEKDSCRFNELLKRIDTFKKENEFFDPEAELDIMFPNRHDPDFDEDSMSYDSVFGGD